MLAIFCAFFARPDDRVAVHAVRKKSPLTQHEIVGNTMPVLEIQLEAGGTNRRRLRGTFLNDEHD